jgi:hypothetical protein
MENKEKEMLLDKIDKFLNRRRFNFVMLKNP